MHPDVTTPTPKVLASVIVLTYSLQHSCTFLLQFCQPLYRLSIKYLLQEKSANSNHGRPDFDGLRTAVRDL